jgi:hypothetical protein
MLTLALVLGFYLLGTGRIGLGGFLGVLLAGGVLGLITGLAMYGAIGAVAGGVVGMLTGAGNLKPSPSFSYQEALVMQGKHQEAVDAYRAHLTTHPDDHDARLALADLLVGPMALPVEAERELLAVRAGGASEKQEFVAAQALIDLYAATGQRGKQMAELARFAERYRGTVDGAAAKRVLAALKDAGRPSV